MNTLTLVAGYIICVLIGLLGLLVLWKIMDGSIDLSDLISEENGGASMSRFQFLVFTFVISLSLFLVIVASTPPAFPPVPGTILALLGISGSSYLVSKGIQFSDPAGIMDRGTDVVVSPAKVTVRAGQTQQFKADVPSKPGSAVTWELIAGLGEISNDGLYKAPETTKLQASLDALTDAAKATPGAPAQAPHVHATIQVNSVEFPGAYDLAVVTLVL
ncbi:MAG: hypothetical protein ACM3PW_00255 [Chlamydiota bacterium]